MCIRDRVEIQAEARAKKKAAHAAKKAAEAGDAADEKMIREDAQWTGDDFVDQSDALSRG